MSIAAGSVAKLIAEECGITRDLGQKSSDYLTKPEMLSVYAYLMDLKVKNRDAEEACRLAGLDPELINTLKKIRAIGKADGKAGS